MIECALVEMTEMAGDVVHIDIAPTGGRVPEMRPGQYIEVVLRPDCRIPLSVANLPHKRESRIELHLQHGEGRWRANELLNRLRAGESLWVDMPKGDVWIDPPLTLPLIMIAGGTGFAQSKSILQALLASQPAKPLRLFWRMKHRELFYMLDLLDRWSEEHSCFEYAVSAAQDADIQGFWREIEKERGSLGCFDLIVSGSPQFVGGCRKFFSQQADGLIEVRSDISEVTQPQPAEQESFAL